MGADHETFQWAAECVEREVKVKWVAYAVAPFFVPLTLEYVG